MTSGSRSAALADVPSLAELGYPELDTGSWMALAGPKNLPPEIVERWNGVVRAFLGDATAREKLESMGFRPEPSSPEQLEKRLRNESDTFLKVVRDNRISAD